MGKRKEKGGSGEYNRGLVIICNIIIALVCVASIVTLYLGSFWDAKVTVNITKDTISKVMGEEEQNTEIKSAEGESSEFDMKTILSYIPDDFNLPLSIDLKLEGQTMTKSAFSFDTASQANVVKELVATQVNTLMTDLTPAIESVLKTAVKAVATMVAEKAKEEVKKGLSEGTSSEETKQAMEDAGIKEEDIDKIFAELDTGIDSLMEGDTQKCKEIFSKETDEQGNKTEFTALLESYAKETLKNSNEGKEPTAEEIATKVGEIRGDVTKQYDEVIEKFSDDEGKFSVETAMVKIIDETGAFDDSSETSGETTPGSEGEKKKIESAEDVKVYITEKIMGYMDEDTTALVAQVMQYIGYFLLLVMASWAYLLIKVIVKSFMRNKTVSMAVPRIWGWMPHVLLVGVPMLVMTYLDKILEAAGVDMAEVGAILDAIEINFSSLTWVSAAGTVVLMVISFFYRRQRKSAKGK